MLECRSIITKSGAASVMMTCPVNNARCKRVDMLTVKSLVRRLPLSMPHTQYYFCDSPHCDVVYFASDAEAPRFCRKDLTVGVGAKETVEPITICYCFGFTNQEICNEIRVTGKSRLVQRIAAEVEAGRCAFEVKNPSGKCCLGDVTRTARDGMRLKGESKP